MTVGADEVIGYLADVARSVPELGLRAADVDRMARELTDCVDIDTAALQADSELLRSRMATSEAVPTALEHAVTAMPAAWSGSGGAGAVQRAAVGATLARADLQRTAEIADTLAAAAAGIDEVRSNLGRRLGVVDVTGIDGLSIAQVRNVFDAGDVEPDQVDAWSAEIRFAVELVATAAADTRGYVSTILGIAMTSITGVPAEPFPDRVQARMARGIGSPAVDSVYPSGFEVLDAALGVATAIGSVAENVANIVGAGIEAAAALAPDPQAAPDHNDPDEDVLAEDVPDQDEPTPDDDAAPTDVEPPRPPTTTEQSADRDSESVAEETQPRQPAADPAAATEPSPSSPPPPTPRSEPDTGAESGLALLGDG
jgi:hypothetical protein